MTKDWSDEIAAATDAIEENGGDAEIRREGISEPFPVKLLALEYDPRQVDGRLILDTDIFVMAKSDLGIVPTEGTDTIWMLDLKTANPDKVRFRLVKSTPLAPGLVNIFWTLQLRR